MSQRVPIYLVHTCCPSGRDMLAVGLRSTQTSSTLIQHRASIVAFRGTSLNRSLTEQTGCLRVPSTTTQPCNPLRQVPRHTVSQRLSSVHRQNYHPLHSSALASSSFVSRWLSRGRGMRRRIGAWADSLGVTSGHPNRNDRSRTPEDSRDGEELFVMPGWAVVKHREGEVGKDGSPAPFDLHVSVSGFCSEARPPSAVSRTQRVIVSVVRRESLSC
jgi:hypothetical protein